MARRIVVTGVAGFVASNLARHLLDRGNVVIGIDNLNAGTLENVDSRVEFHKLDICDRAVRSLLQRADAVFHLAAKEFIN